MSDTVIVEDVQILRAQDAVVELLRGAIPEADPRKDDIFPQAPAARLFFLNVVLSARPPEILAEAMGLDEDESEIEYVQTIIVEWIVRDDDVQRRPVLFRQGLAAIDQAVRRDRTLGGLAHGLTVGPPQFDTNPMITATGSQAALIPLRVALRGTSLLS